MDKVWVIEDPDERPRAKKTPREKLQPPDRKSPAAAYSLSLLLWGMGQFYADLIVKGLVFFFLMVLTAGGAVAAVVKWTVLLNAMRSAKIAFSDAFLAGEVFLLMVLLFWAYNAADAYHVAARERARPFTGVKGSFFPTFCSLLLPGWGQYLNGQSVKGGIFASLSVIGLFALLTGVLTILAWPFLEPSRSRDIVEGIFAAAFFVVPFVPFLWLFGCYDAFQVSSDDYLKEPFFERLKATNNRRRTQGWMRGVFPRLKHIFVLFLVLALFLAIAYWTFPQGYYISLFDSLGQYLRHQGMTILPEIIRSVTSHLPVHP